MTVHKSINLVKCVTQTPTRNTGIIHQPTHNIRKFHDPVWISVACTLLSPGTRLWRSPGSPRQSWSRRPAEWTTNGRFKFLLASSVGELQKVIVIQCRSHSPARPWPRRPSPRPARGPPPLRPPAPTAALGTSGSGGRRILLRVAPITGSFVKIASEMGMSQPR